MQKKFLFGVTLGVAAVTVIIILAVRGAQLAGGEQSEAALVNGVLAESVRHDGRDYIVPPTLVYDSLQKSDALPSLQNPAVTSIANMDGVLGDDVFGIDVAVDGTHRFYPYQILNWHYVINDTFGDKTLAVTYDPLTASAMVFERSAEEKFSATGFIYENSMLLGDGANDWWQTRGIAVIGPRAGDTLATYPSEVLSWGDWKDAYPNGEVLSDETGFARDYARHPYGGYDAAFTVYFPVGTTDTRIEGLKSRVFGVVLDGQAMAFVNTLLKQVTVANESVGGNAVVGMYDPEQEIVRVFRSTVDGQLLTFIYDEDGEEIVDNETGSIWSTTGIATSGELRGTQLAQVQTSSMFWFAWSSAYADTMIAAASLLAEPAENVVE